RGFRIRKVIAAAGGQWLQAEIPLDEFNNGDVVRVTVADVTALAERRNDQQRDAGTVSEEIDGLDVTGIVVAAAFILRDKDCRAGPHFWLSLHRAHDVFHEPFEQFELRIRWVTIRRPAG